MSFFQRLQDSTIGFSGYPRLARDRAGGFGYMAFLLFIVITIGALISTVQMRNFCARAAQVVLASPDFSLTNGALHYAGPMPAVLMDDGTTVIIVDTTGTTKPDDLNRHTQGLLITGDHVYQHRSFGGDQAVPLTELPWSFQKQDVANVVHDFYKAVPFIHMFFYPFQLGFKALDAVILAYIATWYASRRGRRLPFAMAYKLALYAMTLPMIMQWVVWFYSTLPLNPLGLFGFFAWWSVAIMFVIGGTQAYMNADDNQSGQVYADQS